MELHAARVEKFISTSTSIVFQRAYSFFASCLTQRVLIQQLGLVKPLRPTRFSQLWSANFPASEAGFSVSESRRQAPNVRSQANNPKLRFASGKFQAKVPTLKLSGRRTSQTNASKRKCPRDSSETKVPRRSNISEKLQGVN